MRTEPIRRRRRLITRRMIVDTARRLFREEGYRGTTLDMVASELGVTRAALYHWMPSKETLLGEIHDEAMDLLVERFDAIIGADRPAIDKLADAVRNHIITVAENLDTIAVFFQDEASLPEEPARRIARRKHNYDHALQALVREAQADGSLRPELDARITVETMLGMCNWIYHWYNPAGKVKPADLAEQVLEMIFVGLRPR
jgi:AcrR family transcriptional regulator